MGDADQSSDGVLSLDEVREVLRDPKIRLWLAAMELDVHDADFLFRMLDDDKHNPDHGDFKVTADKLTKGIARLKGGAKSLDMVKVLHDVATIKQEVLQLKDIMKSLV